MAAAMSWTYSVTLGLLFAACASGEFSLSTLRLPGVVPVTLISASVASILITPVAAWSVRTGVRNLRIYGPVLWAALAVYIVLATPKAGAHGLIGVFCLSIVGLIALGFVPAAE